MKITTELQNAINDGYHAFCEFIDGDIHCQLHPGKKYLISQISIIPKPCPLTQTVVYRINFQNGLKGFAILDFQEDDGTLY